MNPEVTGGKARWALVGLPDHQGVTNVGGRLGAALGPAAFKKAFGKLNGRDPVHAACASSIDVGPFGSDVAINHRQAADAVRSAHAATGTSVVVGGGHDHGFSHLLGLKEALSAAKGKEIRLGCINIDAHLDVRKPAPLISSGSPFYLALEAGTIAPADFIEFGIQSHCNAPALWEYVEGKGVQVVPFRELRGGRAVARFDDCLSFLASRCDAIAISLDLDAAASAFAPGVSAPQAEGFSAAELVEMMEIGGRERKTVSLGIFELNPEHDQDGRTAILAATCAWHFVAESIRGLGK